MKTIALLLLSAGITVSGADNPVKNDPCESIGDYHVFGKGKRCTVTSIEAGFDGKAMEIRSSKDYSGIWSSVNVRDKGPFILSAYIKMVSIPDKKAKFTLTAFGDGDEKKQRMAVTRIEVDPQLINNWVQVSLCIPAAKEPIKSIMFRLIPPGGSVVLLDNISLVKATPAQIKQLKKPIFNVIVKPAPIGNLKITKLGDKLKLDILRPKLDMFSGYGKGECTLQKTPDELIGFPFVKNDSPYKEYQFTLNEPGRTYWLGYTMLRKTIPANWKMYRQNAAAVNKFNSDKKMLRQNVYYRDLPAGKFRFSDRPNRFVNLAIKPFSVMSAADCVMNILPTTKTKVYVPGKPVILQLITDNPSGMSYQAQVDWLIEGQKVSGSKKLTLTAGKELKSQITLPALPEGFYLLKAKMMIDNKLIDKRVIPVAVIPPGKKFISEGPFFPFGVYNKFFVTEDPTIMEIYYRWICNMLVSNNINTLVGPALDSVEMETNIADEYGLKLVMRTSFRDKVPENKTIITYMFGDEPKEHQIQNYKKTYEKNEKLLGKPLVSCLIAGVTGTKDARDPLKLWKLLNPKLRLCRLYPYRKNNCGLVNWAKEKYQFSPAEIFRKCESATPAPWWYVIQTFGKPAKAGKEPYWRNPTANEIVALTHLALANGARGILGWAFQRHGNNLTCVVDQFTLKPLDDKLSGLKKIGGIIKQNSALLLRHKRGDFSVKTNSPDVIAVPRFDPKTGKNCIYVINLNPKQAKSAVVTFSVNAGSATDVYSGKSFKVSGDNINVNLEPAQGMFLELK